MTRHNLLKPLLVCAAIAALPILSFAQHGRGGDGDRDRDHEQPAVANANVDFGVLPIAPLGPAPCIQVAPFGGANDPCAYKLHHLTPEEVTILKGGEVTFQVHGGGHGIAIYEVDKDTKRDEVGQYLCAGIDPATIPTTNPLSHVCNATTAAGTANAAAPHNIADGDGDVVIVALANVTNVHPDNRVWSPAGRLMSAGGVQFLNGGTTPTGTSATGGQLVTYRFAKNGRYIIICMNRSHFLNDWMFGFVNVTSH